MCLVAFHIKNSVFIIYLLEDEQELSLGMPIRLQRIYNFYCSMLLYYHSWMFYNHFIATLYHFLGLTYWHGAQCQLLFFACFLLHRISVPNGVQTQRNFLEIFSGPEATILAKKVLEGRPVVS